ncbi:hypothetical protein M422DRAFT_242601 [Sphaerobolus stellatus SS14]|nr:hypothetical protein M422DRAFT_242601 [Sphaerobolus stellatus SS14]
MPGQPGEPGLAGPEIPIWIFVTHQTWLLYKTPSATVLFLLASILTNITCICHSATNPDVILRQKPPFSHPFLQKVLSLVAVNPQSRPALDAHFPDAFDPICLKTLAFVCTMTHFALANLLKEK